MKTKYVLSFLKFVLICLMLNLSAASAMVASYSCEKIEHIFSSQQVSAPRLNVTFSSCVRENKQVTIFSTTHSFAKELSETARLALTQLAMQAQVGQNALEVYLNEANEIVGLSVTAIEARNVRKTLQRAKAAHGLIAGKRMCAVSKLHLRWDESSKESPALRGFVNFSKCLGGEAYAISLQEDEIAISELFPVWTQLLGLSMIRHLPIVIEESQTAQSTTTLRYVDSLKLLGL